MDCYQLYFSDDEFGVARIVEFDAEDIAAALIFAHAQAGQRRAELRKNGAPLCQVGQITASAPFSHALQVDQSQQESIL